ncbi:T9SS type A sorting domain-containing protein [bacterium]|nr:T9SS type A sorting domain-containing protein [bacterium]
MLKLRLALLILAAVNLPAYSQSVMLVGGGVEGGSWSNEAYSWFVQEADSGIIINIDWNNPDPWYADYFIGLGADPQSHAFEIPPRPIAEDSATYYHLITASGIFLEDGYQWQYVVRWQNTMVTAAIQYVFENGGAIGGIGAGAAVLGDVILDAQFGYPDPEIVAYDPYHTFITFTDDFLDILPNVFPEPFFNSYGQLGRLVPMIARRVQDYGDQSLMGIGIEQETAFCVSPDLNGTVYGETVTIISPDYFSFVNCVPGEPPTFTDIHFHQLLHHATFNLDNRSLIDPGVYLNPIINPPPDIPQFNAITLDGSDDSSRYDGEVVITNLSSNPLAWWQGLLGQTAGNGLVPNSIVMPEIWDDPQFYANRISGGYWGLASNEHFITIYLDNGCYANINNNGLLTAGMLTYVLNGISATWAGTNAYRLPGIYDARLHFLSDGDSLRLDSLFVGIEPDQEIEIPPQTTKLLQNYPNPFNAETTISFNLPVRSAVTLSIHDIQGKRVEVLVEEPIRAGYHQRVWRPEEISSGIYLCKLIANDHHNVIKLIYLK